MLPATFEELAPDLRRIRLMPFDLLNVYLLGDVLVDAGTRGCSGRICEVLSGVPLRAVALTHGHFDHGGGARDVCEARKVPLWCGDGDREAVETGDQGTLLPPGRLLPLLANLCAGPPHPVARVLREGDEVAGFTVLETPGHTPGHLAFWREEDGVLVAGDVLWHRHPITLVRRLREPTARFSIDPALNRRSAEELAALEPSLVCFGHGPPLRDPRAFREAVAGLGG